MELLTACLFQALDGEPEVLCEQAQRRAASAANRWSRNASANALRTHPEFARRIEEHQWGSFPSR
jgi:hypothetical protein